MKTVGVNQPHVAHGGLASDRRASDVKSDRPATDGLTSVTVVDKSQIRDDESGVSPEAIGSAGNSVSTLEAAELRASEVEASELEGTDSDASESDKKEALAGDTLTPGSEIATDESIISTADLRDVFNRLEVIVQKLARGGAVW